MILGFSRRHTAISLPWFLVGKSWIYWVSNHLPAKSMWWFFLRIFRKKCLLNTIFRDQTRDTFSDSSENIPSSKSGSCSSMASWDWNMHHLVGVRILSVDITRWIISIVPESWREHLLTLQQGVVFTSQEWMFSLLFMLPTENCIFCTLLERNGKVQET